jgi:undecaprenyl-diphosphatase
VKTFEVVIQVGAIAAVLGLYRQRARSMWQGLRGRSPQGTHLLTNLGLSVMPALAAGVLLRGLIKARLFARGPAVWALAAGGLLMIALDPWLRRRGTRSARTLDSLSRREALLIGAAQCLALWPGTSRAMVTLVAGMALGLPATAAAEYSFLLAVPTLGAAAALDLATGGAALWQAAWPATVLCGFAVAWVVAALTMRGLIWYLTRHGLALFGWYRIALAAGLWCAALGP